jgi:hypothetical protein
MSTKTTIKRIALVAVSALGLGVLTGVTIAPQANAAAGFASFTTKTTEYINAISATTDYAPVAGANGSPVQHTVVFKASTTAAVSAAVNPNVVLASAPSTSALAEDTSYDAAAPALKRVALGYCRSFRYNLWCYRSNKCFTKSKRWNF